MDNHSQKQSILIQQNQKESSDYQSNENYRIRKQYQTYQQKQNQKQKQKRSRQTSNQRTKFLSRSKSKINNNNRQAFLQSRYSSKYQSPLRYPSTTKKNQQSLLSQQIALNQILKRQNQNLRQEIIQLKFNQFYQFDQKKLKDLLSQVQQLKQKLKYYRQELQKSLIQKDFLERSYNKLKVYCQGLIKQKEKDKDKHKEKNLNLLLHQNQNILLFSQIQQQKGQKLFGNTLESFFNQPSQQPQSQNAIIQQNTIPLTTSHTGNFQNFQNQQIQKEKDKTKLIFSNSKNNHIESTFISSTGPSSNLNFNLNNFSPKNHRGVINISNKYNEFYSKNKDNFYAQSEKLFKNEEDQRKMNTNSNLDINNFNNVNSSSNKQSLSSPLVHQNIRSKNKYQYSHPTYHDSLRKVKSSSRLDSLASKNNRQQQLYSISSTSKDKNRMEGPYHFNYKK